MKRGYLPFEEAREYVRKQQLKNSKEWKLWSKGEHPTLSKRPDDIPPHPDVIYHNAGWKGWSDWIGTKVEIEYLPFEEAREYIRNLGLRTAQQWQQYYKGDLKDLIKPDNIPWNPQVVYAENWINIKDWLGTAWRSFEEAREYVRNLGLDGQIQWRQYCKGELLGYEPKPSDIPANPASIYEKTGWIDIGVRRSAIFSIYDFVKNLNDGYSFKKYMPISKLHLTIVLNLKSRIMLKALNTSDSFYEQPFMRNFKSWHHLRVMSIMFKNKVI